MGDVRTAYRKGGRLILKVNFFFQCLIFAPMA